MEQLVYHIHQHLTLYDHGKAVTVPWGIGMPGGEMAARCFYWIHVHDLDPGMIHVESPNYHLFHLGNFFDIWKATASDAVPAGDAFGKMLAAKPWHGSYRTVPLTDHAVITLEIGKPVIPPAPFAGWHGEP
jgi:hypothetical protein